MNDCATDRGGELDVRQMVWRVENVKRAVTHFDVTELRFLQWRVFVNHNERSGMRSRAQSVINQSGIKHLIGRQEAGDLADVLAFGTIHAGLACAETSGIG